MANAKHPQDMQKKQMHAVIKCLDTPTGERPRGRKPTKGCGHYFPLSTRNGKGQSVCPKCGKKQRWNLHGGGSAAVIKKDCRTLKEAQHFARMYEKMGVEATNQFMKEYGLSGGA